MEPRENKPNNELAEYLESLREEARELLKKR